MRRREEREANKNRERAASNGHSGTQEGSASTGKEGGGAYPSPGRVDVAKDGDQVPERHVVHAVAQAEGRQQTVEEPSTQRARVRQ